MILELVAVMVFGFLTTVLGAIEGAGIDFGALDFGPVVGLVMGLDAYLPMHEVLAAVALVLVVDAVIWAFDTFDWLYEKLPFV